MKKLLLTITFSTISLGIFAQQMPPGLGQASSEDFAMHKSRILEHLRKMTECVNQAQDRTQMKSCRTQNPSPQAPNNRTSGER